MTAKRGVKLSLLVICFGLITALAVSIVRAAPAALPPRPEPTKSPSTSIGAYIQLQLTTNQLMLWTVVQWQDALGGWHDVEGWRGTLDSIDNGIGYKTWWVASSDFGKGPFRWAVYPSPDARLLATSAPFNLPGAAKEKIVVEVALPQQAR